MSVAFEYGGIDREPVLWAQRRERERQSPGNFDEKGSSLGEQSDMPEISEIHLMIITQ